MVMVCSWRMNRKYGYNWKDCCCCCKNEYTKLKQILAYHHLLQVFVCYQRVMKKIEQVYKTFVFQNSWTELF